MAKEFVGQEYVAATNGKGLHQESKGMRIWGRITITLSSLVTILSVVVIAFCVIFSICPINGTSMMTTLNATGKDTDSAIVCYLGTPHRGDIVISKLYLDETYEGQYLENHKNDAAIVEHYQERYPNSDSHGRFMLIIKRLIAVPGDIISMCRTGNNYYLYLNGEKLNEDYLDPSTGHPSSQNLLQMWNILDEITLQNCERLKRTTLLRDWLSVPYEQCVSPNTYTAPAGSEASTLMLTVPDGYYFLMGDNRDGLKGYDPTTGQTVIFQRSWDSTYIGPVPKANYVSLCVDVVDRNVNMPEYIWNKFVYYVCFGWAWQK